MALGRSAIDTVRSTVGHIQQANASIQQDSATYNYVLSDAEFSKMISDTDAGRTASERITKALEGIGKFTENVESLAQRTEEFLARQEEINSQTI